MVVGAQCPDPGPTQVPPQVLPASQPAPGQAQAQPAHWVAAPGSAQARKPVQARPMPDPGPTQVLPASQPQAGLKPSQPLGNQNQARVRPASPPQGLHLYFSLFLFLFFCFWGIFGILFFWYCWARAAPYEQILFLEKARQLHMNRFCSSEGQAAPYEQFLVFEKTSSAILNKQRCVFYRTLAILLL